MQLLAIIALAALAATQAPPTKYDGTWIAQFEGTTHVRLELRTVNGAVTGSISLGDIEMNQDGTLKHVEPAPKQMSAIFDVRRRDAVIVFSRKDADEADRFEFELIGAGAELRFILTDELRREIESEGLPIPKPIRLKRG